MAVVLACAASLAWREHGSIARGSWLPYAVLVASVAAVVLLAGVAARPSRAAVAGLAGLVGLGVWDAVSIAWAPSPALARDEALLTVFYALAYAVGVLTLWTEQRRLAALGAAAAVAGGVAVASFAALVWGGGQLSRYYGGRLAFPISYVNATGALFAVGLWPALLVAARRSVPAVVRALAVGAAAACVAGCVMTQSKGSILGLAVASAVVFAVSPLRLRLLVPFALVGGLGAAAFGPLTAPFRVYGDAPIRSAGGTALTVTTVAVLAGLPYALLDAHLRVPEAARRAAGRVVLAAVALAAAAGIAAFLRAVPHPEAWAAAKWRAAHHYTSADFRHSSTHLVQLGSNRFDFWRVGIGEFERRPLLGDGARGFGPAYLRYGRSDETPRRGHSLPLDALSETGIVGFLLLAAGLGFPLALALRRLHRGEAAAVGAVGGFLAWLGQACVDWTWTLPPATVVALVLLGVGAAARDGFGSVPARAARPAAAVALAVAALAFVPPWLAARWTQQATADGSPAELARAHALDPLSTDPLLASVWVEPLQQAVPHLLQAVRQEPRMVATRYTLGYAYLRLGLPQAARPQLEAALRLKPHDRLIEKLLAQTR